MSDLSLDKVREREKLLLLKLEEDRAHAIEFDNYGKAAVLDGEIKGIAKLLSAIDSGDLNI